MNESSDETPASHALTQLACGAFCARKGVIVRLVPGPRPQYSRAPLPRSPAGDLLMTMA